MLYNTLTSYILGPNLGDIAMLDMQFEMRLQLVVEQLKLYNNKMILELFAPRKDSRTRLLKSVWFYKLKKVAESKLFFWIVQNELCSKLWKAKHRDTGPQMHCFLCSIKISMDQNGVCNNFCLFLTQSYDELMRINEKVAQTLRCSYFKSGATKGWSKFLSMQILSS